MLKKETSASRLVTLPNGQTATLSAVGLLMNLVNAGIRVRVDGTHLMVGPPSQITPDVDVEIRNHRDELIILLRSAQDVVH